MFNQLIFFMFAFCFLLGALSRVSGTFTITWLHLFQAFSYTFIWRTKEQTLFLVCLLDCLLWLLWSTILLIYRANNLNFLYFQCCSTETTCDVRAYPHWAASVSGSVNIQYKLMRTLENWSQIHSSASTKVSSGTFEACRLTLGVG